MVKNHRKWSLIVCKTMIMKVNKSQIQQWWWQWKASVCFYFFPSRSQTIQCQVVGSMASSLESLLPLILQDFEVRVCRIRWTWQNKWWQPFLQKLFLSIMKRAFCSAGGEWWEMRSVQRQGYEQAQVIAPLCDTDLNIVRVAKRKLESSDTSLKSGFCVGGNICLMSPCEPSSDLSKEPLKILRICIPEVVRQAATICWGFHNTRSKSLLHDQCNSENVRYSCIKQTNTTIKQIMKLKFSENVTILVCIEAKKLRS